VTGVSFYDVNQPVQLIQEGCQIRLMLKGGLTGLSAPFVFIQNLGRGRKHTPRNKFLPDQIRILAHKRVGSMQMLAYLAQHAFRGRSARAGEIIQLSERGVRFGTEFLDNIFLVLPAERGGAGIECYKGDNRDKKKQYHKLCQAVSSA